MLPSTQYQQLVGNLNQRIEVMLKSDGFNNVETLMLKRYLDGLIR
ncbi:hypothetical protein ECDEC12D_2601 [Escherichia coli DEC12D]|nr:hypothetical protein ECDEC12D_2601 [Escherichia coli DEC12D]